MGKGGRGKGDGGKQGKGGMGGGGFLLPHDKIYLISWKHSYDPPS